MLLSAADTRGAAAVRRRGSVRARGRRLFRSCRVPGDDEGRRREARRQHVAPSAMEWSSRRLPQHWAIQLELVAARGPVLASPRSAPGCVTADDSRLEVSDGKGPCPE
jgi:hypothetical protein